MLRFFIAPDTAQYFENVGCKWLSRSYSREIYVNVITEFPDFPAMEYGRAVYCYAPSKPALAQLICKKADYRKDCPLAGIIYRRIKNLSGATAYQWTFFFDKAEYEEYKAEWVNS